MVAKNCFSPACISPHLAGDLEVMESTVQRMRRQGIALNEYTYTAMMRAYARAAQHGKVRGLWARIKKVGVRPPCSAVKMVSHRPMRAMQQCPRPLSAPVLDAFAHSMGCGGFLPELQECVDVMRSQDGGERVASVYASAILAYAKAGDLGNVQALYKAGMKCVCMSVYASTAP